MILWTRLYLIILLALLQFAAPLIHAHTNSVAHFSASIHLPEFEQVNAPKHAPEFLAPSVQNDNMIAMSSGIKNKTLPLLQSENTIFVLLISVFFMAKNQRQLRSFLAKTEPIPHPHFFNLAAPRAPPFFPFF
ncbi:MAG: hypothetical protein WCJ11_06295 [Methylococcaceae bacterium]